MKCGTTAGYRKHYTNKEKPCDICKLAQKEYNSEWRKNNKISAEYRKKWREKNKEKVKRHRAKYQEKHREIINKRSRDWRNENKELANNIAKKWKLNNVDKNRSYKRKSNRKRRSVYSEPYTEEQVLSLYGSICYICNNEIDLTASRRVGDHNWRIGLHIDHVIALSKGGIDTIDNVRPTHAVCNMYKGSSTLASI